MGPIARGEQAAILCGAHYAEQDARERVLTSHSRNGAHLTLERIGSLNWPVAIIDTGHGRTIGAMSSGFRRRDVAEITHDSQLTVRRAHVYQHGNPVVRADC